MKSNYILIAVSYFFCILFTQKILAQGVWKESVSLPSVERENAVGFALNNKVYLGTGASDEGFKNDLWEFDPTTEAWTQKADLPSTPRELAIGFSAGNLGYIGLGLSDLTELFDLWSYNPIINEWTQRKNFDGGGRYAATSTSIDNIAYVGLGRNDSGGLVDDFWSYSPELDDWTELTSFTGGSRERASSFAVNGKVYVGLGNSTITNVKNDLYEYDIVLDSWIQRPSLPGEARSSAVSYSYDNFGVVGLGNDANIDILNDFWLYNTTDNQWAELTKFPGVGRFGATLVSIDEVAYVIAGSNGTTKFNDLFRFNVEVVLNPPFLEKAAIATPGTNLLEWSAPQSIATGYTIQRSTGDADSFESIGTTNTNSFIDMSASTTSDVYYRIVTNSPEGDSGPSNILLVELDGNWTRLQDFNDGARSNGITFEFENNAYMGAGVTEDAIVNDFWRYDASDDTWTQLADIGSVPRADAKGFVSQGSGYVVLGEDTDRNLLTDVFKYDFQDNIWTQVNDFEGSTRTSFFTFVINDIAYLGLGNNSESGILRDVWRYDTVLDDWVQLADFNSSSSFRFGDLLSFTLQGKGYIINGNGDQAFHVFDPETEIWEQLENVPYLSGLAGAMVINERAYAAVNTANGLIDLWEFNPLNKQWRRRADFPEKERIRSIAFSINNIGYLGFGSPARLFSDFWSFNPNSEGLATPQNLQVASFDLNSMTITWDDISNNEAGFIIELSTNNFLSFFPLDSVDSNITSYEYNNVRPNVTYFWRIRAYNTTTTTPSEIAHENSGPNWVRKADYPGLRKPRVPFFNTVDKGYYIAEKDNWEYNPENDTWTQKADFPGSARSQSTSFGVLDKGYLVGGDRDFIDYINEVWEFDPLTNQWSQKQDFPDVTRVNASGFGVGGKGYMALGETTINGDNNLQELWEYNPAEDEWIRKTDFPGQPQREALAAVINDRVFVGLGRVNGTIEGPNFYEYLVDTDEWEARAEAPINEVIGFATSNAIYVNGITNSSREVFAYIIEEDRWKSADNIPSFTGPNISYSINGRGYLGLTGTTGSPFSINRSEFWEFIPIPFQPSSFLSTELEETLTVKMEWVASNDFTDGYFVERSVEEGSFITIDTLVQGTTTYINSGLEPSTTYNYRIVSFNEFGNSPPSGLTVVSTPGLPNVPSDLTISESGAGSLIIVWQDNSENELRFELERSIKDADDFELLATIEANTTEFIDNSISDGQEYDYTIRAVNVSGNSSFSEIASLAQTITSLNQELNSQTSIFPNPSSGIINIDLDNLKTEKIEILAISGQIKKSVARSSQIDISDLSIGVYFLRVYTNKGIITEKIVLE